MMTLAQLKLSKANEGNICCKNNITIKIAQICAQKGYDEVSFHFLFCRSLSSTTMSVNISIVVKIEETKHLSLPNNTTKKGPNLIKPNLKKPLQNIPISKKVDPNYICYRALRECRCKVCQNRPKSIKKKV